ncbi:MAG: sigma-54-dependent Fis family transcriptional regulator [Candidatus Poribacteria bacterium]|nr:MAG: sigma-54-dependent Fis family transcriptional regulator [Candidatus Poribacteria bacterium]
MIEPPALEELRILIVDDEPDIVRLLEVALRQAGFSRLSTLTDPRKFFDLCESFQPDLILLDLMMPYQDGFAILERLRTQKPTEYLPVLVITAQGDHRSRLRAFALGAQDFIVKPFDFNEVVIRVRNLLYARALHQQLSAQAEQLRAVLDATSDGLLFFGSSGEVLFVNRKFSELFGLEPSEAIGRRLEQLHEWLRERLSDPDSYVAWERRALAGKAPEPDTVELQAPSPLVLLRNAQLVRGEGGAVLGVLIVYRDISREARAQALEAELDRLRAELRQQYRFDHIVGQSRPMQEMFRLMERAAESDITVLITGESGTGKELVAKAIHFNGHRREGPFVVVNCAAIPESLIESELFGHEKGAFTGATQRRIGKFEQASGGTLFLDEIGEMTLSVQAKLLRVLQEREIQRVGGTGTVPVDVRVIAATNKDLQEAVRRGLFREDLYYRVAAFPIRVPPLRERREDVPLLAEHFLTQYSARFRRPVRQISPAAMRALLDYDWPGNVRELENVLQRAILLEESQTLHLESLPPEVRSAAHLPALLGEEEEVLPLDELERRAIQHALRVTEGNISQAARLLGINRVTLYRKLRRYHQASSSASC